jgi:EAL domain-containing protein (putative c-di-GMP-specific phosphodiesterase class I)
MTWQVGAAVSILISITSFAIVAIVGRALWRTRQLAPNVLAVATAVIVFTVGVGHLIHAASLFGGGEDGLALRAGTAWGTVAWDSFTALAAIALLSQRRQLSRLLQVSVTPEELELRRALDRGEMEVEFQPHVSLVDGRLEGFEALVRWRHPGRGLLLPADFVPLAEETGLIDRVGEYVLEAACRAGAGWPNGGATPFIAVNLSVHELERDDLEQVVADTLERTGLEPHRLVLEVTETGIVQHPASGAAALAALRGHGVRVALDDFGTGYSALSKLAALPVDAIKLARAFVEDLEREETRVIVGSLVDLAQKLGLVTVAEGVETVAQAETLAALGCEVAQGYLFGRPVSTAEAARLARAATERSVHV